MTLPSWADKFCNCYHSLWLILSWAERRDSLSVFAAAADRSLYWKCSLVVVCMMCLRQEFVRAGNNITIDASCWTQPMMALRLCFVSSEKAMLVAAHLLRAMHFSATKIHIAYLIRGLYQVISR